MVQYFFNTGSLIDEVTFGFETEIKAINMLSISFKILLLG